MKVGVYLEEKLSYQQLDIFTGFVVLSFTMFDMIDYHVSHVCNYIIFFNRFCNALIGVFL